NFKLDAAGEYLALIRAADDTAQFEYAPAYPPQSKDISFGLSDSNDPASARIYFSVPSPGANNAASVATPVFSTPGKTFFSSTQVGLSTTTAGAEIRYTTDRAVPTASSLLYTGPITLTATTEIRARAFAGGYVDSPITSQSYVAVDSTVNAFGSNLPIVVLDSYGAAMDDANWRDSTATFIN